MERVSLLKQLNEFDWETPQRQSPFAILILFLKTLLNLVKSFWPILLIYWLRGKEENEDEFGWIWLGLVFGLISILITLLKYWFYKFHLKDKHLHIQSGWWRQKQLAIPLKNIQAVHLEQDVWQRLLGVTRVAFDSTGSNHLEARIDALPIQKAEELKAILLQEKTNTPSTQTTSTEEIQPKEKNKVHQLEANDLLKLSLSANHFEAFFILLAIGFRVFDELSNVFELEKETLVQNYADEALRQSTYFFMLLLLVVAVTSVLVSAVRTLLKYYDFRLEEGTKNWKVSWGFTTRQQRIVPLSKVQMMSYQSNWLRRKFNFWILNIYAIGESKTQTHGRLSLPFTSLSTVLRLTEAYLPHLSPSEDARAISKAYWQRKVLLVGLPLSLISAVAAYFLIHHLAAYFGIVLFVYAFWHYYHYQGNFKWYIAQEGLWIHTGVWGRKFTLINWQKIQQIEIRQSLYQTRHQLANLRLITAGGGATLPYIKLATAQKLKDELLYLIEIKYEDWL